MKCLYHILESPYAVAIFAALIAVGLTYIGSSLYDYNKSKQRRKEGLSQLKVLLANHLNRFKDMETELGQKAIHAPLSTTPFSFIINNGILDIYKDKDLLSELYIHIENIELINRVFKIVDARKAGFTQDQYKAGEATENSLKEGMPEIISTIEKCIQTIDKKLT